MRTIAVVVAASIAIVAGVVALDPPARAEGLNRFSDCDDLLKYVRTQAADSVGPYGWDGLGRGGPMPLLEFAAGGESAASGGGEGAGRDPAGPAFSGTNSQVEGVDEPDMVETDGAHIFTLSDRELRVVRAGAGTPELVATLALGGPATGLILSGERLLVLSGGEVGDIVMDGPAGMAVPRPGEDSTFLTQVDVSDPTRPRVAASAEIPGRQISARAVAGTMHLVTSHVPQLDFVHPGDDGVRTERAAERSNRTIVAESRLGDWLPPAEIDGADAGRVDCTDVLHPEEFAGPGLLTVSSFELDQPFALDNSAAILASGDLVYSSVASLYVATSPWQRWSPVGPGPEPEEVQQETKIHQFDISGNTTYQASGEVRGELVGQFAMSENDGVLRVASTVSGVARGDGSVLPQGDDSVAPPWDGGDAMPPAVMGGSVSAVTVLRREGAVLRQIGSVGDLGRGESIHAVRFFGDVGYVVTFRQTDPLYTIDLSVPRNPKVLGELKINGYSAYLHPLSNGRLLGVGQDASARGRLKGTQVSLFDVGNLSSPRRLDRWNAAGKWTDSEVEYDHHAFLYWAPDGIAVIPVSDDRGASLTVLKVDDSSITARGTIEAPRGAWGWQRSLVIDGTLYAASGAGITATDLESLRQTGVVKF